MSLIERGLIESVVFRLVDIKPESDGIKWYSVAFFELFAKYDRLINNTAYEGVLLPTEGPALVVCNHTSMLDTAKGYRMGQRSGRIIRTYTRESFLDPNKKESETVRARTGQKSDILNSAPMWLKYVMAKIPQGVEAIPVPRGGGLQALRDFRARGKAAFEAGFIVAIFSSETREKSGKLLNPLPGAEFLASDNPDLPIYPAAITTRKPHRASIGKPFTYNQMLHDPIQRELARTNFTVLINDKVADQLDPLEKQDWYEIQRPKLLTRRRLFF